MLKKRLQKPAIPNATLTDVDVPALLKRIKKITGANTKTMARWCGRPRSTLQDWALGLKTSQLEAFLRLYYRLSVDERHSVFDDGNPVRPTIEHPYIARDRQAASELKSMLACSPTGVIFVRGDSTYVVTFVSAAIANTFADKEPQTITVSGLDLKLPTWLVPVDGVEYVSGPSKPENLFCAANLLKPQPTMLFNRVYGSSPVLDSRIESLASTARVIVAKPELKITPALLRRFPEPRHIVSVSLPASGRWKDDAAGMQITVA